MNSLIIDTTSESLCVALLYDDKEYIHFNKDIKRHNSEVMPAIDSLIRECGCNLSDIDCFAAVTGPGSFTGIRIGVTIMNAFSDVYNKPLIDINTFEMISYNQPNVIALIDARNNNYYGAEFMEGKIIRMGDYRMADIDLNLKSKVYRKNINYGKELLELVKIKYNNNDFKDRLSPLYLKDSQAERERAIKSYKIEQMSSDNLEQVLDMESQTFPSPWTRSIYIEMLDNSQAYNTVISVDNEIIGYAVILQIYDEMHIMKIAVKNNYRRQGYGDILLSHIIDYTINTDAKQITLEVRVSNVAAQTLYKKYKFQLMGKRLKYYEMKEDALIYTLELGR